jgi:hypothetical protein
MRRLTALLAGVLAAGLAAAQSVEDLKRELTERDALIKQLRERIDALEAAPAKPAAGAPPSAEDDERGRALERALMQQGGLLLRRGTYELQPELAYAHWDRTRGLLRDEAGAALTVRAGLPGEAQFQVRVPYLRVSAQGASETAFGDVSLALSKEFVHETRQSAGVIGSLGWTTNTGKDALSGGVPTGSGFNQLTAELLAIKRLDPLMFFGGVSYTAALPRRVAGTDVRPGDLVGLRFGSILAASPETALTMGLNLGFAGATRLNGQRLPGSSSVLGTLQLGVSTVLTRDAVLNLTTDIGVDGNVPNFRLTAGIPIRF